ncbi:MAG TPA: hypothetical protein VHX61_19890 [Rhizomicrobium sp.]|nr:hypothetical protein [Rhizomicrobium sp.]
MNRLTEVLLSSVALIGLATSAQANPQDTWRAAISQTPLPGTGCYAAHYPSLTWKQVACVAAPHVPLIPATGSGNAATVGNGHDYQAVVTPAFISTATGSFTKAKTKTETGDGESNAYTIQLNSNFMSGSPACAGAKDPPDCLDWEQFVYFANPYNEVFIQYWLINYDTTCPSGWLSDGGDCYTNSNATGVPLQAITDLKYLTLTGTAVAGGDDTLKFMTESDAYSVTNNDDMVYLADYWQGNEFNVVGPGGGSEADFSSGTRITVNIAATDGTTTAPDCVANDGTTGETNNLNLKGKCKTAGGSTPSVSFKESLAK